MDYKKKYEKVLERAKEIVNNQHASSVWKEWLCHCLPELKESEDEKIRKEIEQLIQCMHDADPRKERWLAWLEKQKVLFTEEDKQGKEYILWCIKQAKKHAKDENEMGTCWFAEQWLEKQSKSYTKRDVDNAFIEGMAFAKNELEKQGELKPIFDVEIPFGAKDSELIESTYFIPKGFHAEIIGDEVHIKQVKKPQSKSALEAAKEIKDDNNANKVELKDYYDIDPHFGKPIDFKAEHFFASKVDGQIHDMIYNPDNKLELSKFHEGDWIVNSDGETAHIVEVRNDYHGTLRYYIEWANGSKSDPMPCFIDNDFHLWTIQDAKNGDVLTSGDVIFIFNKIHGVWINCYCSLHKDGSFNDCNYDLMHVKYSKEVYPATKEQHALLFQKMKEAGYEWDADKKELKKVEE